MKNKFLTVIIVLLIGSVHVASAGDRPKDVRLLFTSFLNDSNETSHIRSIQMRTSEMSSRQTTALIYSCILPGSGQTMLGSTYKGVGFTLLAFGSALTAGISHNNFIARNERLDALEFQYANATTWENADLIYTSMRGAHSQLKRDKNRRDLFLVVSAVVWVTNILDIIYITEDEGQSLFSMAETEHTIHIGGVDLPHKPLLSLSLPLK